MKDFKENLTKEQYQHLLTILNYAKGEGYWYEYDDYDFILFGFAKGFNDDWILKKELKEHLQLFKDNWQMPEMKRSYNLLRRNRHLFWDFN